MRVTVIATVLNEGQSIRGLLDSLLVQTRRPDEVVIVDGGSSDDTVSVVQSYGDRLPISVLVEEGCNISRGRNRAAEAATGDVIASTDAGVRLAPMWLEELARPFEMAKPMPSVVSGFFVASPKTLFETAMGATVLPVQAEIDPDSFLPSSRSVAFTRQAWQAVGGYPEWLDYSEDLVFDLRLKELHGPFAWAPRAVAHFRPRTSLRAFFVQYYRYARGDGKADLWRKRHVVRYATYFVALPGLVYLASSQRPDWLVPLVAAVFAYCWTPWQRLRRIGRPLTRFQLVIAGSLVPLLRAVGDVAKMIGYPAGWFWRLRNWRRAEIHWRRPDGTEGSSGGPADLQQ